MADEVTVPLLPCRSIDDVETFYRVLGFEVTHRQERPTPHLALRREDLVLHFFGMPEFEPEQSYGSCLVQVTDTGALYEAFAAGMRDAFGKVLLSGIPRITRPRKKQDGMSGFSLIDPGGNWIRISAPVANGETRDVERPRTKLARALHNAGVLGDSKGDHATAARVLDRALAQEESASAGDRVEALVYRAELAITMADSERARGLLAKMRAIELDADEQERVVDALANASDLELSLTH
jgi:hypothetical protein